ncbi:J domain-containing protein [Streptomyces sp. NPDC004549]|uniref:J domain-containing protein n=1 Tax=Streptomyces sp. NPDC004549 TaxID=3154283 RepID=UPI0033A26338
MFHNEFDQITISTPLKPERVVPLLYELADADPSQGLPISRLYRTAAAIWHPDRQGGDYKVFQLLQEAYRTARPDAP